MDIPYGFDCYTFQKEEIKYFEKDIFNVRRSIIPSNNLKNSSSSRGIFKMERSKSSRLLVTRNANYASSSPTTDGFADHVKFTRKNEDYPKEQVLALGQANRLNFSEIDKRIFCGIKIQLGIGVVTSFLRKGLQYKPPIKGRSELINGSWTGIMKGLTIHKESPLSYDLAFGNFLAWDEEFPYIKFGPFFAIESKLVMLTGSSHRIEASSFGTNITKEIWLTILSLLLVLSILASFRIQWQATRYRDIQLALEQIHKFDEKIVKNSSKQSEQERKSIVIDNYFVQTKSIWKMFENFFFIYITMLLNKPSLEFDELIWPRNDCKQLQKRGKKKKSKNFSCNNQIEAFTIGQLKSNKIFDNKNFKSKSNYGVNYNDNKLQKQYDKIIKWKSKREKNSEKLPTSIRILSYMWSAACLVIASIYSGEMLAVMLLHADTNVDTISQLINSKPSIEPVIRQDDFTYNLMLKSLDENMAKLHSKTRIIPRQEVYTRQFIESVSQRKVALLGDDELIETIYDLYHKYYPLYKSKMTYLQYPISIMYRKDLNSSLELKLRRGLVQMFEMGLVHRWYQAQKDTYIQFYDTYERKSDDKKVRGRTTTAKDSSMPTTSGTDSGQNYKPLSMAQFESFFKAMFFCILFASIVLIMEIFHYKLSGKQITF